MECIVEFCPDGVEDMSIDRENKEVGIAFSLVPEDLYFDFGYRLVVFVVGGAEH
jgi:hypothetical protein